MINEFGEQICDFGCGQVAPFQLKNGKHCCSASFHQCPAFHSKIVRHLEKNRSAGIIPSKKQHGYWKCEQCSIIFDTRKQLSDHQMSTHGKKIAKLMLDGSYECPYCGKRFNKRTSLMGHCRSCKLHPNKAAHDKAFVQQGKTFSHNYKTGKIDASKFHRPHTVEEKQKLSEVRSRALQKEYLITPYAHVKWYKVKNNKGEEFSVRGHWEEAVAKRLNDLDIYWIKSKPLKYFDEFWHNYTPDLYIPSLDVFVEVKGRYPEEDRKKMRLVHEQHPGAKIYFIHRKFKDFISGKIPFDDDLLITDDDL